MSNSIGKNIKYYRKKRSLTQEQLAEAVGFSAQNLKLIENGTNLTSLENFIKICKILDVPADLILADEDKKFKIAAIAQMTEKLSKLDDDEFDSISKSIEMIYFCKTFEEVSEEN